MLHTVYIYALNLRMSTTYIVIVNKMTNEHGYELLRVKRNTIQSITVEVDHELSHNITVKSIQT